ncbi:unnamed protein product [Sphagnum balticum]
MEEEQEACIGVSGATTTTRYNNRSSSREITDPVLEIGGLGFLKTNSLGEGERENIYSVESVTSGGLKNHTLTTEDASVEQLTGNKSVLSGCFKEGSLSRSILGTTKEVNEVEDRQTGCMEKELCILVPSVEFQLKLKRMVVENNVENWVPKASTEDGDLVAMEITEMAEIDCAEVAQTVDSVAIEYGNTKDSGKTKDYSGFDKGSSITDQEDGVGPTHGGGRDRGQMNEGETVTDDLTTAVRQQLRRRAKKKGEADTSPPGEGESLCNKGKGDGNSKILGTSTQVLEEDFESGVAEAMAVVMKVHGVLEPAADPAASFPGMVGLDTKRECHCCQKPESLRNTIVCDNCESSFHLHCVDLQRKQVAELENWHCLACGLAVGVGCWPLSNSKLGLVRKLADSKISNEGDGTRFTENRQLVTRCQEALVHDSEGSIATSVNLKAREAHSVRESKDMKQNQGKVHELDVGQPVVLIEGADELYIAVPSYFLKEDSGKDAELKEKEDTLQMLRSFVAEKHGELGNGWDVVIRRRQGNDRVCDKYFVSPDKQRFRSRLEVVRYLGLVGGKGGPKKRNACVGSRERALVNNSEQTVTKGVSCSTLSVVSKVSSLTCCCVFQLKSQIGHGDLPLERLGAMKSWSGELDGPHTLPSGYKSTWHDSETGSLCICEVVGGEQSRLVFRVTRKSFFPVAELDGVAVVCADSAKHACDNGFDLADHSTEKDHTRSGRSELSSFVTQKSIDEVQLLQSNIQTRSDPIQRAEALQDMTAPEVIPVGFKPWPLDEIGEFVVEAASPSDAWKLFVQEFMTRIRRSHTATKALCSHVASRIGQKQDAEVSGNASLVFDHELGNKWCQIPGGAVVEMAERSDENKIHGETGMAVHKGMDKNLLEEVFFKRLEARLAKSQFGINQPVVQEVTQVLQGVGNDNIDKQVNQTLEGISGEILQKNVQSELTNLANQEVSLRSYERSPPPTGQPLGKKLPTELVGDLLEAWEFLHRFSELIGQESLPTFEDLEAGLSDMGLDMEGKRGDDSDVMTADGSVQATAEKCTAEANVGETAQVHGKELGRGDGAMMPLDSELDHNVVTVAHAHIPLLKFLLADMQYRVLGDPTGGRCEEPKKRGRPLLNEPVPVIPEFGGDLPVNEVTWPELAHRYLVTLIEVKKSGDPSGLRPEERRRLIRCLQGDGGVLFGAAATVVAVESDAQVLAEAEMELSLRLPNAEKKDKQEALADDEKNRHYPPDEIPPWVKALEPVRTMPTNVGARIRAKVREALDLHPVKWAADILEWSISRDIFKGNASGPTKRAVVQVLAKFYGGSPAKAQRRKTRKPVASPDHLMQCCRIVLRHVADADKGEVFSILIGGPEGHGTGKVRGMVARPLDFRTIDARLAAGAYGGLPEAFAADVRQIWRNVEEVHGSGSDMVELANSLSQLFESLYQKQVLSLIEGDVDTKDKSRNSYGDADHMDRKFLEKDAGSGVEIPEKPGKLLKAPWEDDDTCRVCGVDEDYERIMLCDGCEAEYHTYCLDPPLQKVPEGNWFCPSCVSVKRGFPEATAVVGGEETGAKNAVNGLEGEDGHGFLTLIVFVCWVNSNYQRVQFLKILCDNALETPQIRAHLEKSLDTASELRTQLHVLKHIGEDPTPTNLSKLQPSQLLENNADSAEKLQDSLCKLDAEIGQVETKLWNMNVRRDHLGTDDLGREYWAFCGSDNQPFLVVAEEGFVIEATGVSTSGRMDGGTVESRKMKFKWWVYKGEEALDSLVSWLISESKGERSLKVSIHEWRRSVFTKHQHPDEELNEVKLPLSCSISGKEGDKSVHPVMMTTRKPSRIGADIFPRVKATVILEARYGSSGESSSSIKQLNRCECLEPLWRTRSHCQSCHETYESSVELLNHQKMCPIVQSPGTDFQEVETQPLSNKRKWGNSSSGMVINSASSERKTESRPGSSKCTRLSGDNENLKRPHSADRLCMIEEASVFASRPATRILANETGDDFGLFPPEAITLLDYKWDYLVNVPPTTCQVSERLDGDIEGYYPSSYANVDNVVLREDSVPSSTALLGEVQTEGFKQDTSEQSCGPETAMPVGVTGKKPAKKFPVLEAATCPLVGDQKVILRGLQLRLLDIEAAMTKDMLEPARSSPVRRRAWRFLVKSTTCIYQMTKAIILLEHMVKVEFLKKTWCQWSSLSAAARSVTVSSLALKVYALDASITYRIKGKSDQEKQHPTTSGRKGKKKRHLHVKTK